jgi:predicted glycoside hydrolase/deacetylase ChbG (UPF0249 family)
MNETTDILKRLGYAETDKLLIIHADDAGMSHSANEATLNALETGIVTCASVMVPCPWALEIARYAQTHPEVDLGVHLTLTSEWNSYRWGPLTPPSEAKGLIDSEGYMYRSVAEVEANATPEEVKAEIRAQISRALALGLHPTHIDSHMGTLFAKRFFPVYQSMAKEKGIMPMLMDLTGDLAQVARNFGLDPVAETRRQRDEGFILLDRLITGGSGDTLEARRDSYFRFFHELKPGITEIIVHLSMDDEEIQAITNHWPARWHEYQIFTDPRTRDLIESLNIRLIGYKELSALTSF